MKVYINFREKLLALKFLSSIVWSCCYYDLLNKQIGYRWKVHVICKMSKIKAIPILYIKRIENKKREDWN